MEGGSTSEPWTCERGMKSMRPNAGFCDKVRPVTTPRGRPETIRVFIADFERFVLYASQSRNARSEQSRNPRWSSGRNRGGVENATCVRVSKAPNGTSRFVTPENRPITEKLRLRRRLLTRTRRRIVCDFCPQFRVSATAVERLFLRSARSTKRLSATFRGETSLLLTRREQTRETHACFLRHKDTRHAPYLDPPRLTH